MYEPTKIYLGQCLDLKRFHMLRRHSPEIKKIHLYDTADNDSVQVERGSLCLYY